MKKTRIALVAAWMVALLLLTACANNKASSEEATTPVEATPVEATAPAAAEIAAAAETAASSAAPTEAPAEKAKPETIAGEDINPDGGADSYGFAGDNAKSRYYVNPDFYSMKSDESLTLIEQFKTFQQTDEWSCGNATALMVLSHMGRSDMTEIKIAEKMGSHTDKDTEGAKCGTANNFGEYGTNVKQMYEFFSTLEACTVVESSYKIDYKKEDILTAKDGVSENDVGNLKPTFASASLYSSDNSDDTTNWVSDAKDTYFVKWLTGHLKAGHPIMVEWGDWDGHWQAIIGYDTNGTPGIGDDMLIFADPYDTSDHWQDGYYYYPLERWFYMWKDRNVAPKPLQLQPYIIVANAQ